MKFARKFLYKAEDGAPSIIITGLDLMDILAHITYLIHYLYNKFKSNNPAMAEGFCTMLVQMISDPASPVWEREPDPAPAGTVEGFFIMDKEDAET